jgi:hypothetical protein
MTASKRPIRGVQQDPCSGTSVEHAAHLHLPTHCSRLLVAVSGSIGRWQATTKATSQSAPRKSNHQTCTRPSCGKQFAGCGLRTFQVRARLVSTVPTNDTCRSGKRPKTQRHTQRQRKNQDEPVPIHAPTGPMVVVVVDTSPSLLLRTCARPRSATRMRNGSRE